MRRGLIRILAAVIAALMCFQMLTFAADEKAYEGDKNYTYFEVLSRLGILPRSMAEKNPEYAITRGQFAQLIAGAFGLPEKNNNNYFSDVDVSAEYAGSIMSLYDAGVVRGNANGSFYPEQAITPIDAAVIITRLLGYEAVADQYGGYESGYLVAANEIGLFKGVGSDGATLSISSAVRLVFNSLTADIMENKSYNGFTRFEIAEDSSRLLKVYGLEYTSGVVQKNAYTGLADVNGYSRNYITVNGVTYYDGDGMGQDLLGYHADLLYKEEDDGTFSVFLIYASKKNNVIRIDAEDIYKTDGQTIYYEANGEELDVDVSFNASIIYNEVADLTSNGLNFIPTYGELVLIDNDNNYEYDVVFVKSYQTFVALGVDDSTIIDIDDNQYDLSNIPDDKIIAYKNGKPTELSTIVTNDVVSLCFSRNNESVVVYASDEKVTGVLKQYSDDEYKIGENDYIVTGACLADIVAGNIVQPKVGDEVVAYLDFRGYIAYFEEQKFDGYSYGYVMALDEPSGNALKDTILRVINHKGEIDDLLLKADVTVDLNTTKTSVTNLINNYLKQGGTLVNQLVKYKKNNKNELTDINFAKTTAQSDSRMLEASIAIGTEYTAGDAVTVYSSQSIKYRPSGRCFDGYAPINADTVVFKVPPTETEKRDKTKYQIGGYTLLANDQHQPFCGYDAGEAGVLNVLVLEGAASGKINPEINASVISDIKMALDKEGNEVLTISYMIASSMKSAVTRDKVNYSTTNYYALTEMDAKSLDIGIGDIAFIELDSEGKVLNLYRITDASLAPNTDMTTGSSNPSSFTYNAYRTFYGKMVGMNGSTYMLTTEDGTASSVYSTHYTGTRYTYIDLTARDVAPVKVTADYLSRCNNNDNYRVLARSGNSAMLDCFIYKIR